jgi:hypothetical protein
MCLDSRSYEHKVSLEAWPFLRCVQPCVSYQHVEPIKMQELQWPPALPCLEKNKHTVSIANTNIPINKQSSRAGS